MLKGINKITKTIRPKQAKVENPEFVLLTDDQISALMNHLQERDGKVTIHVAIEGKGPRPRLSDF